MNLIKLGRRKLDALIMADWEKRRGTIVADVRFVVGAICLEPHDFLHERIGVIVFSDEWKNIYILMQRMGWNDGQYFELAGKLFKEKGIETP